MAGNLNVFFQLLHVALPEREYFMFLYFLKHPMEFNLMERDLKLISSKSVSLVLMHPKFIFKDIGMVFCIGNVKEV